jgi:hypothetical protein
VTRQDSERVVQNVPAIDHVRHHWPPDRRLLIKPAVDLERWIDEDLGGDAIEESLRSLSPWFVMDDDEIEIAVRLWIAANDRSADEYPDRFVRRPNELQSEFERRVIWWREQRRHVVSSYPFIEPASMPRMK